MEKLKRTGVGSSKIIYLSCLLALAMLGLIVSASGAEEMRPLPNRQDNIFVARNFQFQSGETLSELKLGYTTLGTPKRDSYGNIINAVLLLHGTTGTGANWLAPPLAEALFREGEPLDAGKYYLILADSIGLGRSSKPSDGLKAKFPHYGYRDMVEAQYRLVTEGLGIKHLRLVLGTSMGGMHTWLWAEHYPEMMDGAVAIACQPTQISGRNLLWRRVIMETIRNDPDWNGGNYTTSPTRFAFAVPIFTIMVDSATHLQEVGPTREKASAYYDQIVQSAKRLDANDFLYRWQASADYNPQPDLEKIRARFLALNFADDLLNPAELKVMEREMPRVKNGSHALIPVGDKSLGHQNLSRGAVWGPYVADFLKQLP
ncbi:MAG TPA: alpha/beta fold hydrolase [Methylomirabilota bacterium]|nr:alpha/beta fold hydrolase [Methylomirabilota bacterium]